MNAPDMRICFFGDSLVNGYGDPDCLGWVGRLCARTRALGRDLTCYNLGVRGNLSRDVAERWRDEASLRLPADVDGRLVFSFGVVDALREIPIQATIEHARGILDTAGVVRPLLMIGPTPVEDRAATERIARLSASLAELCAEFGTPYLPVMEELSAAHAYMADLAAGDGIHPELGGYVALTELIEQWSAWRSWLAPLGEDSVGG